MKRYLLKNKHQLSGDEKNVMWHSIQKRTGRSGQTRSGRPGWVGQIWPRRRTLLPAFGLTTVTAMALLAVMIHFTNQPEKLIPRTSDLVTESKTVLASQRRGDEPGKVQQSDDNVLLDGDQTRSGADVDSGTPPTPVDAEKKYFEESHLVPFESDQAKETPHPVTQIGLPPKGILGRGPGPSEQTEGVEIADRLMNLDVAITSSMPAKAKGGRNEALLRFRPVAEQSSGQPGSVTGGTTPPNGEKFELMYFEHAGVNPFVATEDDALSTFAVDVDNASYTLTRNYLGRGELPPKDAIRVEEFVNFFAAGYPEQRKDVFQIHTDGTPSRFGAGYQLLRVGLQGKSVKTDKRKPANLVFVIDVSGSMDRETRLGLVKRALHILLDELEEGDKVGLVVYGSRGEIKLDLTDVEDRETLESAIDALHPGGSTNAAEGLALGYELARKHYEARKINRLILCSDGVANMGTTRAEEILTQVRKQSDAGITLSSIGFGMGNYNDVLLEKMGDKGDGNYYYVDRIEEAERVFKENLTGLLQTIARQVKIQVEFDPAAVQRWRLLGYENRDVADRDFRNDDVDAGEVGAAHQVTALYEIKLKDQVVREGIRQVGEAEDFKLGTVNLRHEAPAHDTAHAGEVTEINQDFHLSDLSGSFATGPARLRLQAVAAEFAEILRGSFWAKESRLRDLIPVADAVAAELPGDKDAVELAHLIRVAANLEEARELRENLPEK